MGPMAYSNKIPREPRFNCYGHGERRRCDWKGGCEGDRKNGEPGGLSQGWSAWILLHLGTMEILPSSMYNKDVILFSRNCN
jgi:hypothetical protein